MTDINPETKTLIENQIKDHAVDFQRVPLKC